MGTKIGDKIKYYRELIGLTQDELAEKVGYKSRSAIAKIESGIRDINQSQVEEFARALRITPSKLMGWDEEEPQEEKKPHTIAAHATEDLDEEDIEEIYRFIDYIKSKKKK